MPRHLGIRKRKELKGGSVSNVDKLAEEFVAKVAFGKSDPTKTSDMSSKDIKKKFSI